MNKINTYKTAKLPLLGLGALLFVTFALLANPAKAEAFYSNGVGDGSSGSPYQIYSCNQLSLIATEPDAYYVLTDDISCSDAAHSDSIVSGVFTGSFDGQGHQIFGINIDATGTSHVGLFSELAGTVKNVSVYGTVVGGAHTGIIAGNMKAGALVSRVDTHGSVTCTNNCGGIVGSMVSGTTLEKSSSDATIGGVGYTYGGLVGWVDDTGGTATISDVYYRGTVSPSGGTMHYTGGIVGFANHLVLTNAYATGNISGGLYVGGIAGIVVQSTVTHTFSAASVNGVGTGVVFGGNTLSTTTNNFYDEVATSFAYPDDGYGSTGVEDPDFFKQTSATAAFSGWDFPNVWMIEYNDYPTLKPIHDPYMLCEAPQSTDTTIYAACSYVPRGWGIPTWEARYQKQGDSIWTNITLDNVHIGMAEVTGLTPGTWYNLQFRFTNDFGTGQWGTVQILTTGSAPTTDPAPTTNDSSDSDKSSSAKNTSKASDDTVLALFETTDTSSNTDQNTTSTEDISANVSKETSPKTTGTSKVSYVAWGFGILIFLIAIWLFRLLRRPSLQ